MPSVPAPLRRNKKMTMTPSDEWVLRDALFHGDYRHPEDNLHNLERLRRALITNETTLNGTFTWDDIAGAQRFVLKASPPGCGQIRAWATQLAFNGGEHVLERLGADLRDLSPHRFSFAVLLCHVSRAGPAYGVGVYPAFSILWIKIILFVHHDISIRTHEFFRHASISRSHSNRPRFRSAHSRIPAASSRRMEKNHHRKRHVLMF